MAGCLKSRLFDVDGSVVFVCAGGGIGQAAVLCARARVRIIFFAGFLCLVFPSTFDNRENDQYTGVYSSHNFVQSVTNYAS